MLAYFIVFAWLPIGSLGRKAALWCILGIPGIWWVDLQIDGVKKGYELKHFLGRYLSSNHAQPLQLSHIQDNPRQTSSHLVNHRRFVHFPTRQHLPRRNLRPHLHHNLSYLSLHHTHLPPQQHLSRFPPTSPTPVNSRLTRKCFAINDTICTHCKTPQKTDSASA